jgi:glyoxylase-like metal-dependent hydrolase (beta-lactamase superfamily II)
VNAGVESIITDVHLPAGVAGPDPLDFDVRCFLLSHASGVVLIDTSVVGREDLIDSALARIGATWHDITDVVLTHNHPDHIGGLAEVMARVDGAAVWVGAGDQARVPFDGQLRTLVDGARVRDLRVLRTPGHTPATAALSTRSIRSCSSGMLWARLPGRYRGDQRRSPRTRTKPIGAFIGSRASSATV